MNPKNSQTLLQVTQFIKNNTNLSDTIFGEPTITNYVSFVTKRKISANYLDSYPRHLLYEGEQNVLQKIKKDPPKIFIEMNNLYSLVPSIKKYFLKNYILFKTFPGIINYQIYIRK